MIIECGDYFIAELTHKFPGAIISMKFNLKPRAQTEHLPIDETVWRGTWLIGIGPTFKNGADLRDEANKLAERIFFTHGIFIQYLIVEEDDGSD